MTVVEINKIPVTVIVDTGAGISILNGSFFDDFLLRDPAITLQSPISHLWSVTATEQVMKDHGCCELEVTMGGATQRHVFRVLEDLEPQVILGIDLLTKFGATIDLKSKVL